MTLMLKNQQLEILGNNIGDILILLEQEVIGASKHQLDKKRIRMLIDIYASLFDEILEKHRVTMSNELKKLVADLCFDLEKIAEGIKTTKDVIRELRKQ